MPHQVSVPDAIWDELVLMQEVTYLAPSRAIFKIAGEYIDEMYKKHGDKLPRRMTPALKARQKEEEQRAAESAIRTAAYEEYQKNYKTPAQLIIEENIRNIPNFYETPVFDIEAELGPSRPRRPRPGDKPKEEDN